MDGKNINGELEGNWESEENMKRARETVTFLLKDCPCQKTKCNLNKCSCKKQDGNAVQDVHAWVVSTK